MITKLLIDTIMKLDNNQFKFFMNTSPEPVEDANAFTRHMLSDIVNKTKRRIIEKVTTHSFIGLFLWVFFQYIQKHDR